MAAPLTFTPAQVRLGATAADASAAIRCVGELLVAQGCIAPAYVESMLRREAQANTFLGHGVAIPHGQPADRALIHRTGVALVQFPAGVPWRDGQTVHLAVGIAARGDEHLPLLAALTDVLDDPAVAARLAGTREPGDIVAALLRAPAAAADGAADPAWDGALTATATLPAHASLHARPAAALVELAADFLAEIRVRHAGRGADARSMAALLKLGAGPGSVLELAARGPDAVAALAVLGAAVAAGLGDGPEADGTAGGASSRAWVPVAPLPVIAGVSASPGFVVGRLHRFSVASLTAPADAPAGSPAQEHARSAAAVARVREELQAQHDALRAAGRGDQAAIFRAHAALLTDPDLLAEVGAAIVGGQGAAAAWAQACSVRVAELARLADARLAGRAADYRDLEQRLLRALLGAAPAETAWPDEPVILLADDLAPSDTARLDPRRVLGFCTAAGGPTSHTAIIARSLGLPAVVGAGAALAGARAGTVAILDGTGGRLHLDPDAAALADAAAFAAELARGRARETSACFQPALMTDGHRIEVVANIGRADEAAAAVAAGAEGVGLLRTEFLFIGRADAPDEEEQFAAFRTMTAALGGLPLIIRTLDIGGDKVVPYLNLPKEDNPFLGVRGIRLCLRQPELFRTHLRAIYRAAATGPVKLMFPMIATLEDWRAARDCAEAVRRELAAPPVELGIMIEVPAAVLLAPELAREVDFFSIGTNDLTQYTLAIDRLHPELGRAADEFNPAVLRLIDQTVRAATAADKWVGVCGGLAGDPRAAVLLAGLGVAELSVSPPALAAVKARLRAVSRAAAAAFARRALACATAAEVRALPLP